MKGKKLIYLIKNAAHMTVPEKGQQMKKQGNKQAENNQ
jgi:hypothetical protein